MSSREKIRQCENYQMEIWDYAEKTLLVTKKMLNFKH